MSPEILDKEMASAVRKERHICVKVLLLIQTAERVKHAERTGYCDSYEWLEKKHGYSHSAAGRRIAAARMMNSVKCVAVGMRDGSLNLTTVSRLQSVLRREERRIEREFTAEEKGKWIEAIRGKTSEQVDELLAAAFPRSVTTKAYVQPINEEESRVVLILRKEAVENLRRAQELLSHVLPACTLADVVERLAAEYVQKHAPEFREAKPAPEPEPEPEPEPRNGQRVSMDALKREVLREAGGKCEFRDSAGGQVCGSRWQVEVDHIRPLAFGGSNERVNLRCLCRRHNQFAWSEILRSETNCGGGENSRNT
jgi:hypothetical protein